MILTLVLTMIPWGQPAKAVSLSDFVDMPADWSTDALEKAFNNGLISGFEEYGKWTIKPSANLTRAQMATIVNRAFGATDKGSLTGVRDVSSGDWFAEDMQRAIRMGTFKQDTYMRPNDPITRQEAFTVLARAFQLTSTNTNSLNNFVDGSRVASYAREAVSAMINDRYVAGSDGYLKPEANISRAEFAKVMDNMVKAYGRTGSTTVTHSTLNGNLLINKPNVTVKNSTIKGDLIVGDGVGSGNLILDNTDVTGNILVRGGGINSVTIKSNCSVNTMIVAKVAGNVRIVVEDGADLDDLYLIRGENRVLLEGTYDNIYIDEKLTVAFEDADVDFVKVSATSTLDMDKYCKIERIDVLNDAASTRIDNDGTIAKLRTDARVTLTGSGTITEKLSLTGTTKVTAIAAITGTLKVGSELKAGALTPSTATVNYQWQSATSSGGKYSNISGATSSTYTLKGDELNKYIRVVATGKGNYSESVTSAVRGPIAISTITTTNISGVTAPKLGATPVTSLASTAEYTATISWDPSHNPFRPTTAYTATITLTARTGYTLSGVAVNQFKVAGATTTNPANSGTIKAVFPATEADYASGLSPSLTALDPVQANRMILTLSTVPAADHKIFYQITDVNPSAPVKGDSLVGSGWVEIPSVVGFEISIKDGEYVQLTQVRNSDNKVTRWGKTGPSNDGYTPQIPASGLTLVIEQTSPPAIDQVVLSVSGGSAGSNYFYLVSPGEGTPPIEGTTFSPGGWYGLSLSALPLTLEAASGSYIQVVETTTSNVVLRWGQRQIPVFQAVTGD